MAFYYELNNERGNFMRVATKRDIRETVNSYRNRIVAENQDDGTILLKSTEDGGVLRTLVPIHPSYVGPASYGGVNYGWFIVAGEKVYCTTQTDGPINEQCQLADFSDHPLIYTKFGMSGVESILVENGISIRALRQKKVIDGKVKYAKLSPAWDSVNDSPSLTYRSFDGKPMPIKTGRFLKKFFGMDDATLQKVAKIIDKANPIMGMIADFNRATIHPFAAAASTSHSLGSCMHSTGMFEQFQDTALYPAPTEIPTSDDWADGTGPACILFENLGDKEVAGSRGVLRAFLWPVIMEDGTKRWYLDRPYPASPQSRKFLSAYAARKGWLFNGDFYNEVGASGSYRPRAAAQPAMRHPLRTPLSHNHPKPWLDTFATVTDESCSELCTIKYVKDGGAVSGLSTSGSWEPRDPYWEGGGSDSGYLNARWDGVWRCPHCGKISDRYSNDQSGGGQRHRSCRACERSANTTLEGGGEDESLQYAA